MIISTSTVSSNSKSKSELEGCEAVAANCMDILSKLIAVFAQIANRI